jgi:hypothetical protein
MSAIAVWQMICRLIFDARNQIGFSQIYRLIWSAFVKTVHSARTAALPRVAAIKPFVWPDFKKSRLYPTNPHFVSFLYFQPAHLSFPGFPLACSGPGAIGIGEPTEGLPLVFFWLCSESLPSVVHL